jgi:hypothetical protein
MLGHHAGPARVLLCITGALLARVMRSAGAWGGGEYWRLEVAGALRLTIGPEMDGFLACVHDQVLGDG